VTRKDISSIINLSLSLAKANFKLRTEGSFLGILWYLLDPLLLFTILILVFGRNLGQNIDHYPAYLILGLIIFNFFSTASGQAIGIIANNGTFVKSMKISLESLVISTIIQILYSHLFEIIIFGVFLWWYQLNLMHLVFYLPILFCLALFTLGISFILATAGVYMTDLHNIWKFFTQILFFATPIFYASEKLNIIFSLNPLFYYLTVSRDLVIYGQLPDLKYYLAIGLSAVVSLIGGLGIFKKYQNKFAENL
jgi:ABC-type polysaccharide/polyol phosphate export permease